jgi:hypothetical protein
MRNYIWRLPQNIIINTALLSLVDKVSMIGGDRPFEQGLKVLLQNYYYLKYAFLGGHRTEINTTEGIKLYSSTTLRSEEVL